MNIFVCPECHVEHHEPFEAMFVLRVICVDCSEAIAYDAYVFERAVQPRAA